MASALELKAPNGVDKLRIEHTDNESKTVNSSNIVLNNIGNIFSTEQIFKGLGSYTDPDYGVARAIKIGILGLASDGDIQAKSFTTRNPTGASSITVGKPEVVETPYIDFNSSGNNNDFDVRFMVSGGTTQGTGELNITLGGFKVNGNYVVDHFSNANGSCIRYLNGTQICTRRITANAQQSSGLRHAYAANFYGDIPIICITNDSTSAQYSSTVNITTTSFQYYSSTKNDTVSIIAIGRWY